MGFWGFTTWVSCCTLPSLIVVWQFFPSFHIFFFGGGGEGGERVLRGRGGVGVFDKILLKDKLLFSFPRVARKFGRHPSESIAGPLPRNPGGGGVERVQCCLLLLLVVQLIELEGLRFRASSLTLNPKPYSVLSAGAIFLSGRFGKGKGGAAGLVGFLREGVQAGYVTQGS